MGNGSSVIEKAKQAIPALVAPFTEKLQNEGYNISLRIGGPAKKELLDIIQRYHLDKLHHAIIDTGLEWRILLLTRTIRHSSSRSYLPTVSVLGTGSTSH